MFWQRVTYVYKLGIYIDQERTRQWVKHEVRATFQARIKTPNGCDAFRVNLTVNVHFGSHADLQNGRFQE